MTKRRVKRERGIRVRLVKPNQLRDLIHELNTALNLMRSTKFKTREMVRLRNQAYKSLNTLTKGDDDDDDF